ncbi:MAG: glycosyltransferase family 2 protein [Proteobacteria bacterium]|nr:glycosyltransferase family 2 protein [Pseudomonadota bacterium]
MTEEINLSIIIVSWNTKDLLLQCLRSVISEISVFRSEIIVVDNASTDGSAAMVEQIFPEVTLIKNTSNLGFAKANNIGIQRSRGKYICLINSDIIVERFCIVNLYNYVEQYPQIAIVAPKILNPDSTLQPSCKQFPTLWNCTCRALAFDTLFPGTSLFSGQLMTFWAHNQIRRVDSLSGCFMMVRREAIDQAGLLDDSFFMYAEDKDWCKRFWGAGWQVVFYPGSTAIHFGGASSSIAPAEFAIEEWRANLQYWRKHYNTLQQAGFYLIIILHELVRTVIGLAVYLVKPSKRDVMLNKIKSSAACLHWMISRTP